MTVNREILERSGRFMLRGLRIGPVDLSPWTVARDVSLRNWLFCFGAGIRIESPAELAAEHRQWLERAFAVYS